VGAGACGDALTDGDGAPTRVDGWSWSAVVGGGDGAPVRDDSWSWSVAASRSVDGVEPVRPPRHWTCHPVSVEQGTTEKDGMRR
jgi:hypothetical protein